MASSKIQHRRQRQGSLGLPKDSPPPPQVNGSGASGQSGPSQSLDNLEMMKTIGKFGTRTPVSVYITCCVIHLTRESPKTERKKCVMYHTIDSGILPLPPSLLTPQWICRLGRPDAPDVVAWKNLAGWNKLLFFLSSFLIDLSQFSHNIYSPPSPLFIVLLLS